MAINLSLKEIEKISNYIDSCNRRDDMKKVLIDYENGEISYKEILDIFIETFNEWQEDMCLHGLSIHEQWILDVLKIDYTPRKQYNTEYVKKQFEKNFKHCFEFGSHFDLFDCYNYKGILYTAKGKFYFYWDFTKEEWFLYQRKFYNAS